MGAADPSLAAWAAPAGQDGHSVTAVAHPNIALIKYWGKRDEELVIPFTDSLSMTLDAFPTTTTVTVDPAAGADTITLAGAAAPAEMTRRISTFLGLVRDLSGRRDRAVVDTRNTAPTAAGLASSASGMAALAVAAARAYGLDLDATALSRLARRGSGSAARSIFGGFAVWHAGPNAPGSPTEADAGCYAEPVTGVAVDPALVIALVATGPKAVSSREAMRRTVATSPLYRAWADASTADLAEIRTALARGDLDAVGVIAEGNALGMHATMLAARPAIRYFTAGTLALLDRIVQLRADGICAYATMDAGPNVKVLCHPADADQIAEALRDACSGIPVVIARCGPGARILGDAGP